MQLRVRRRDLLADSLGRQPLRRHPQFSIAPKGNLNVDCRCPVSPIRSSTAPAPLPSNSGYPDFAALRLQFRSGFPARLERWTPVSMP